MPHSRPNTLDNTPVAPPDREEVAVAIQRLKLNKASGYDGLPAELFKAGGDELVRWKACQVIGVLVCSAQYLKRAMIQSAAIIVA